MVICADTGILFSLYGHDGGTPRAVARRKKHRNALALSSLNEFELANALRFAEFRRGIGFGEAAHFGAHFEADRASGRLKLQVCNLADVLDEAKRLSAICTLSGGPRGFDILHVAGALMMKATQFLTLDANQKMLADAEGLEVPAG